MRFHWKDLLLPNQNSKNRLDKSLQDLREKTLYVKALMDVNGVLEVARKGVGVIGSFKHDNNKKFVDIDLDHDWYSYITNLTLGYTNYNAENAFALSSPYTIKFYYFCCHWLKSSGKKLTIGAFRKEFSIKEGIYKTKSGKDDTSEIKRRIIIPAKKILDEVADVSFNFSEIKEGRTTVAFSFKFYKNKGYKENFKEQYRIRDIVVVLKRAGIKLNTEDQNRLSGLVKKYSFTIIVSICRTYIMDIIGLIEKGYTVVDAISLTMRNNIKLVSDSNVIRNETPLVERQKGLSS